MLLTIEAVDAFVVNRGFATDDVLTAIGASRTSLDLSDPAVVRVLAQRFGLSEDAFVRSCMAFVLVPPAHVAAEAVKIPDVVSVLPSTTAGEGYSAVRCEPEPTD